MFHNIPEVIKKRMKYLEEIDSKDRLDGTPRMKRLRQIPSDTGKFLSIMAATAPNGDFLEIGT
ncbi:MAG: O-methyltransferase, partial [Promethearchaeia archaeon]